MTSLKRPLRILVINQHLTLPFAAKHTETLIERFFLIFQNKFNAKSSSSLLFSLTPLFLFLLISSFPLSFRFCQKTSCSETSIYRLTGNCFLL